MSEQPGPQNEAPAKSGYARLRRRHHALIERHAAMKDERDQWRTMYLELQRSLAPLINGVVTK